MEKLNLYIICIIYIHIFFISMAHQGHDSSSCDLSSVVTETEQTNLHIGVCLAIIQYVRNNT